MPEIKCIERPGAVSFTVPGRAIGKGRPRFARGGIAYTPAATMNGEAFVRYCAAEAFKDVMPTSEPVRLELTVAVEPPQSWSKKKLAAALAGQVMPATKPDLDNIVKLYADAMNGVAYRDDKQIVELRVRKIYTVVACVSVTVWPILPTASHPATGINHERTDTHERSEAA